MVIWRERAGGYREPGSKNMVVGPIKMSGVLPRSCGVSSCRILQYTRVLCRGTHVEYNNTADACHTGEWSQCARCKIARKGGAPSPGNLGGATSSDWTIRSASEQRHTNMMWAPWVTHMKHRSDVGVFDGMGGREPPSCAVVGSFPYPSLSPTSPRRRATALGGCENPF